MAGLGSQRVPVVLGPEGLGHGPEDQGLVAGTSPAACSGSVAAAAVGAVDAAADAAPEAAADGAVEAVDWPHAATTKPTIAKSDERLRES